MSAGEEPRTRAWPAWHIVAVLPFLFLLFTTLKYYLRFPWADSWAFVSRLEQFYTGTLTLRELLALHHSHCLFLPQLIMMGMARLTAWNPLSEIALNLLLGVATYALLLGIARRSARRLGQTFPHHLAPVIALIVFSLNQHCNWMWGWQLQIYMATLAEVGGLALLTSSSMLTPSDGKDRNDTGPHVRFAVAIALGIVATLSFASGIAYWAAGLAALCLPALSGRRSRVPWIVVWCLVAAIVAGLFLSARPGGLDEDNQVAILKRLAVAAKFIPVYIGANLAASRSWAAFPIGLAGILVGLWAHYRLHRAGPAARMAAAPFTAVIALVIVTTGITGFGLASEDETLRRAVHGSLLQGAMFRYTTISMLYWVSCVFLLHLVSREGSPSAPWARRLSWTALAAIVALSALSTRQGFYDGQERFRFYTPLAQRVVLEDLDALPTRLQWQYGDERRDELRFLKQHKLSLFRPEARPYWDNLPAADPVKP